MTQMSRIDRGQPVEACAAAELSADKWALLDALTVVAKSHGLTHRTLTVLRALLSFYPGRNLPPGTGTAIVYPSNRVLTERLNGMPESTLRRHLSTLVRTGLVQRRDSANRKRFARFGGVCFGFDLSPLARAAGDIAIAAEAARQEQRRIDALRARIAATRQELLTRGLLDPDHPEMENARLCLRRQMSAESLAHIVETLEQHLDEPPCPAIPANEMSGSDSRIERHIQTTDESISVSSDAPVIELGEVLTACTEYQSFFPETATRWPDLINIADRLHGMIGIDEGLYHSACQRIGRSDTAVTVLCILELLNSIRSPGAYFRALVSRGERGKLNLPGLLKAARAGRLSADNFAAV